MYTTFAGCFVECPRLGDLKIFHDHLLQIDDDGFISAFAPRSSHRGAAILRSASAPDGPAPSKILPKYSFLLPPFCDLHLHAPQALYAGNGLHLPLLQWLDRYAFTAEERIDGDPLLAATVYTQLARRLVENGTGAVLLFGTIKLESNLLLARIFQDKGLRAFVGKLSMDTSSRASYVEPSAEASLLAARQFVEECNALVARLPAHRRLVQPVITPRFVPTCTDGLLASLGALARDTGSMVQSHLAEAKDQVEWVQRTRGVADIDVFARSGLLTARTVHAHCTFLPPAALARLRDARTAVAHCPLSNAYFSTRPFPLREALDLGVPVGLGTDVAGGYDVDVQSAMRCAVVVSKLREGRRLETAPPPQGGGGGGGALDINWKEALYLGTTGGAASLGLRAGPGRSAFEIGSPFDMQQIDLYDDLLQEGIGKLDFFDHPGPDISEDMIEKWWCLGDARNRSAVYIQGTNIL